MTYDTASFLAFLRSLHLDGTSVTTRSGQMIQGPPAPVFELALRLGLGALILDTPRNRAIVANLGIEPGLVQVIGRRMRTRSDWRRVWEELARPHLEAVGAASPNGDKERAIREIHNALNLIGMAYGGDGYYIHTPIKEKREALKTIARLYRRLRELNGDRVEYLTLTHSHGVTKGLLHFPKDQPDRPESSGRWPALVAIHPSSGDKDSFDYTLAPFRAAGFATLCIDLPAHGEGFDGPRLQPDSEVAGVAALEVLAAHPEIDPDRLAVMGSSLGAFYAQRTAAASSLAKACLAYASPFDAGKGLPEAVYGIQENFAYVIGASTIEEAFEIAKPFHLRDTIEKINCPLALVHGTQDHICDFTVPYEVARRAKCPLTIIPIVGADHEVSQPGTERLARPGIEWLRSILPVTG